MDRRQFLHAGLGATLLGPLLTDIATGQGRLLATATAAGTRTLVLDAHSKSLQWLRSADEVAQAAIEMVCGGVCVTVQPYPGHVDPSRVAQELPAFANRVRGHGLRVMQITGPAITDVSGPDAEAIIGAAAQAGCTHYSLGGFTYDLAKPLAPQPDGSAAPGAPRVPGAAGRGGEGPAGGRGTAGRGGRGRAGGGDEEDAPPVAASGGRSGSPRGPANPAGAGSIDANNPLFRSRDGEMPKRPIGGKNAKGAGWSAPNVAMGTGVVSIPRVATLLAEIGFAGPSELQSEYKGLAGAETGADKITMPRP